jgi:hypothetical protein
MKHFCGFAVFLLLASTHLLARNPVPLLYQLSPTSVRPGHAAFTIQVRGTGFVSGSTVRWNGQPLTTTFVSSSLLQAAVPASDVSTRGTASLTVANLDTIASNVIYFPVRVASSTVTLEAGPAGIESGEVTVADFNNDSKPDIAVFGVSPQSEYFLDTYFGTGLGGFTRVLGPRLGTAFLATTCVPNPAADFNNDGKMDLALCTAGNGWTALDSFLGDGTGHYTYEGHRGQVDGPSVAADINGDGNLDFVTIFDDGMAQIEISLGNGKGSFTLVTDTYLNYPHYGDFPAVVGDFNGDGKLDVAIPGPHVVMVFLGNGDGTLQPEVDYQITGDSVGSASSAIVADVNGDGNLDIVTNGVGVLLGAGDGTFTNAFSIPLSVISPLGNLSIGDFNGDGQLDLATVATDEATFHEIFNVLLGNGDGTFQIPLAYDLYPHGDSAGFTVGMADFDNNGRLDFVFGGSPSTLFMFQK